MSFSIYRLAECEGRRTYHLEGRARLTGPDGLIAQFLLEHTAPDDGSLPWEISGCTLARRAGTVGADAERELLLDLYPEGLVEVCLHRVERIVGLSEEDWTDAVLVTRPLLTGMQDRPAAAVRESFSVALPLEARESMEAFGIRGGFAKGSFRWTKPKMNLGAAVCGGRAGTPSSQAPEVSPALAST